MAMSPELKAGVKQVAQVSKQQDVRDTSRLKEMVGGLGLLVGGSILAALPGASPVEQKIVRKGLQKFLGKETPELLKMAEKSRVFGREVAEVALDKTVGIRPFVVNTGTPHGKRQLQALSGLAEAVENQQLDTAKLLAPLARVSLDTNYFDIVKEFAPKKTGKLSNEFQHFMALLGYDSIEFRGATTKRVHLFSEKATAGSAVNRASREQDFKSIGKAARFINQGELDRLATEGKQKHAAITRDLATSRLMLDANPTPQRGQAFSMDAFKAQDALTEHTFPRTYFHADGAIENAGDIYRELAGLRDRAYLMEKIDKLKAFAKRLDSTDETGLVMPINMEMGRARDDKQYAAAVDAWLSGKLGKLEAMTDTLPAHPRKTGMLWANSVSRAIAEWAKDPANPYRVSTVRKTVDKLEDIVRETLKL